MCAHYFLLQHRTIALQLLVPIGKSVSCGFTRARRITQLMCGSAMPQLDVSQCSQVWCDNFIGGGTSAAPQACCNKDDSIALGWCRLQESRSDPRFPEVCNPAHPDFGAKNWAYINGTLDVAPLASLANAESESGFCEVLGRVRSCSACLSHMLCRLFLANLSCLSGAAHCMQRAWLFA